jgi:hypothetical protein
LVGVAVCHFWWWWWGLWDEVRGVDEPGKVDLGMFLFSVFSCGRGNKEEEDLGISVCIVRYGILV